MKFSNVTQNTNPAPADFLMGVTSGGTDMRVSIQTLLSHIYPIGSIYFNASDNTNPATLLGFGTWAAYAAGRVPIGVDTGDTDFNASDKTGGSKTNNLNHSHTVNGHSHFDGTVATGGDSNNHTHAGIVRGSQSTDGQSTGHTHNYARATGISAPGTDAQLSSTTNNLPPYTTVYMWKRTA